MSLYVLKPKTENKNITGLYHKNRIKCKQFTSSNKIQQPKPKFFVSFRENL